MVCAVCLVIVFLTATCLIDVKPALAASAAENTWTTKEPMPQSEGGLRATAVNGKIYVMGGSINYEYDTATNKWTAKTPMPTPRYHFGIAIYQNKIYAIGAWSNSGANEVYDPATDTWKTKTPLPTNRSEIEASVVDGEIHLISPDSHDVYDVATDSWTIKKAMLYPVHVFSSAAINDKIYVIRSNLTQIYDTKSDSWSLGASPPTSASSSAACATTGIMAPKRIYVIGGMYDLSGTSLTQVYDPKNDTWTLGAPMLTARLGLTAAVVNDQIYAIAGSALAVFSPALKVNEQYTPFGYGTPDPSYGDDTITGHEPTVLIAATITVILLVSVGLLVYFKKHKSLMLRKRKPEE